MNDKLLKNILIALSVILISSCGSKSSDKEEYSKSSEYAAMLEEADDAARSATTSGKLKEFVDKYERENHPIRMMATGKVLSERLFEQQDFAEAVAEAERTLGAAINVKDTIYILHALTIKGNAKKRLGLDSQAQATLHEAIECYNRFTQRNTKEARRIYADLIISIAALRGDVFNDHVSADSLYRVALAIHTDLNDSKNHAMTLSRLGGALLRKGQMQEALEDFQESFAEAQKCMEENELAFCYLDMGDYYSLNSMWEDALKRYLKAQDIMMKNSQLWDACELSIKIAQLYLKLNKPEPAKETLAKAANLAEKFGNLKAMKDICVIRYNNRKILHDDIDDETYRKTIAFYNDSINDEKQMYDMRIRRLEFDRQQQSNDIELRLMKNEAKIRHRTNTLIITTMAFVLLSLVYILWTRTRENRSLLRERNAAIKAEAIVRKARQEVDKANRMKLEFIHNITHEIRTPLNSIQGFTDLLWEADLNPDLMPLDKESKKEMVDAIHDNTRMLTKLIDDLLVISELEADGEITERDPINVHAICSEAMEKNRHLLQDGVEMTINPDANKNLVYRTDGNLLKRVISDLVNNACKYTSSGNIFINYSIGYDLSDDEKEAEWKSALWINVTDTGRGIAPENAEKIFQRFEKLGSSLQGDGLGLSICRLVINNMKGKIFLDTSYTGGARFVIRLPILAKITPPDYNTLIDNNLQQK